MIVGGSRKKSKERSARNATSNAYHCAARRSCARGKEISREKGMGRSENYIHLTFEQASPLLRVHHVGLFAAAQAHGCDLEWLQNDLGGKRDLTTNSGQAEKDEES